jgi:hypothetical protein
MIINAIMFMICNVNACVTPRCYSGPVAYRIQLPDVLSAVHNVFHVSQLKKCLRVSEEVVEVEGLPLQPDLSYVDCFEFSRWVCSTELFDLAFFRGI